jgi:hypothetical protein
MPKLAPLACALALAPVASCSSLECGENTIERDGRCVAEVAQPGGECGPGTVYNPTSMRCESSLFNDGGGICGANTTVLIDDAGVRTCVGTGGGGGDCSQPLPCTAPTGANNLSLCGRVYELEDSKPLDDGRTDTGEPWKTIELRVYDPIAFIGNPSSPPIVKALPDSCGRFAIIDVPRPNDGFIAVATDDIVDAGGGPVFGDNLVQTGIAAPAAGGETLGGLRAWVFRRTTDDKWSTSAGLASGTSFGKMGVYIPIFISGAAAAPFPAGPTAGVTIAQIIDSGTGARRTDAAKDYYFDDTDPLVRRTASASRPATGANGTGLFVNTGLLTFSGQGGAPAGTCWAKDLAAAPVGGAYVQERTATAGFCP